MTELTKVYNDIIKKNFEYTKLAISKNNQVNRTEYERGYFVGEYKAYSTIIKELDKYFENNCC